MRRGYSLTELLIVITIMVILVAITLPVARTIMQGTRPREASRQLQAYLELAKARAAQTGRPCGVEFVSVEALGAPGIYQTTQCYLAEVPASYAGSTLDARGIFRMEGGQAEFVPLVSAVLVDVNGDGIPDNDANMDGIPDEADQNNDGRWDENQIERQMLAALLDADELFGVRLAHRGMWYGCINASGRFRLIDTTATPMPLQFNSNTSGGFPYAIRRSPKRFGSPMELSGGTCIDLAYSGEGQTGRQFAAATNRLTIMFQSTGTVASYWLDSLPTNPQLPYGTMHLLVGDVTKLSNPAGSDWDDPELSNLASPNSLWLSIGRNGHVTTAENMPDLSPAPLALGNLTASARRAATGREQMSGL